MISFNFISDFHSYSPGRSTLPIKDMELETSELAEEMEIDIIMKSQNSVEISSSGVASYQRGSSMGRYILAGQHNGSFYYKKEEGKERFLFKGSNGWWVGKDPTIDDGFLFNWSMSEGVPPQDWKYKWYLTYYDDPQLTAVGSTMSYQDTVQS